MLNKLILGEKMLMRFKSKHYMSCRIYPPTDNYPGDVWCRREIFDIYSLDKNTCCQFDIFKHTDDYISLGVAVIKAKNHVINMK